MLLFYKSQCFILLLYQISNILPLAGLFFCFHHRGFKTKQSNCWNPLPGKPVHKAGKCKTVIAMSACSCDQVQVLHFPKNWVLLKHCQTSQEGRILQMTVTIPKTALQCKGNEAGMQYPSHRALQCTHHPWTLSSHKQKTPILHSLASSNYLSWFHEPWLYPCECSE